MRTSSISKNHGASCKPVCRRARLEVAAPTSAVWGVMVLELVYRRWRSMMTSKSK
jgi:hypothetical protein